MCQWNHLDLRQGSFSTIALIITTVGAFASIHERSRLFILLLLLVLFSVQLGPTSADAAPRVPRVSIGNCVVTVYPLCFASLLCAADVAQSWRLLSIQALWRLDLGMGKGRFWHPARLRMSRNILARANKGRLNFGKSAATLVLPGHVWERRDGSHIIVAESISGDWGDEVVETGVCVAQICM